VLAIIGNVAWAQIQPTQSLIGAVIHISTIYALAVHSVAVEIRESPPATPRA
jgi:hypothetical protein